MSCGSIAIEVLKDRLERVVPQLSARTVILRISEGSLPLPSEWIRRFKELGLSVSWRRLGDVGVPPELIPRQDYEGWFIQDDSRLNTRDYGLLFKDIAERESGFSVVIESWADTKNSPTLWKCLSEVASGFENCTVTCGNCILHGNEWSTALEQGLPYLESIDFSTRKPIRTPE